jgi:4-amino-4-deoxy-L-arabinose transferase-like glycosyltransferase
MSDRTATALEVVATARPFPLAAAPAERAWLRVQPLALAGLLWLALVSVALLARPLLPIDETRYLTVAWEMRVSGDWLVPRLNGEAYAHKGPLLFWLINALWSVTGPAEWAARLVAPLFALGCLPLCARLGGLLWPERAETLRFAPLILAGGAFWTVFATVTYFDALVAFGALLAACGVVAARRGRAAGWALVPLGLAIGMLTKGPVALLHVAPLALLAPWWDRAGAARFPTGRWLALTALALALGVAATLAWALPAAHAGGEAYAHAILLGQTTDRLGGASFAHPEPVWWYLALLPAMLLPWSAWPALWRSAATALRTRGGDALLAEPGTRACLAWLVPSLAVLSLASGKLPHYLVPILPPCALLIARLLPLCRPAGRIDQAPLAVTLLLAGLAAAALPLLPIARLPDWMEVVPIGGGLVLMAVGAALLVARVARGEAWILAAALAIAGAAFVVHLAARPALRAAFDLAPMAKRIAQLQEQGVRVSFVGLYHGEYGWLGRLREPLPCVAVGELRRWLPAHPSEAFVTVYRRDGEVVPGDAEWSQPFRGRRIGLWRADAAWASATAHPPVELHLGPLDPAERVGGDE